MGGPSDKPNMDSEPAKQDDWSKETRKKTPVQFALFLIDSPSEPALESIRTYYTSVSSDKQFICFTTCCLYMEIRFHTADGPGPGWPLTLVD